MAIHRVKKDKNFTKMSNYHLKDKRLSNKAIGLLSKMLSLPDDWNFSLAGLTTICKDSKDAIRAQIKELKKYGYVKVTRINTNKGFSYTYDIYEIPPKESPDMGKQDMGKQDIESPDIGKPDMGSPDMGSPDMGKPTLLNTNKVNTNILNTKILNTNKVNTKKKREAALPTLSDVTKYAHEIEYSQDKAEKFYEHYSDNGWKTSKGNRIHDWKTKMKEWKRYENKGMLNTESSGPKYNHSNDNCSTQNINEESEKYDINKLMGNIK